MNEDTQTRPNIGNHDVYRIDILVPTKSEHIFFGFGEILRIPNFGDVSPNRKI